MQRFAWRLSIAHDNRFSCWARLRCRKTLHSRQRVAWAARLATLPCHTALVARVQTFHSVAPLPLPGRFAPLAANFVALRWRTAARYSLCIPDFYLKLFFS
jgi:hypothetical protein